MDGPALLADHLDDRVDSIIAIWRGIVAVDRETPDVERLSYAEFADHVPLILDRLMARLRGEAEPAAGGPEHGRMRWRQGYEIGEVVREMGLLRATLNRATLVYAQEVDFDSATLDRVLSVLNEVIDEAVAESADQFEEESLAAARSARQAAEAQDQAIRHQLHFNAAVTAGLGEGVVAVDLEGLVTFLNPAAESLLKRRATDLVGHPLREAVRRSLGGSTPAGDDPLLDVIRNGETRRAVETFWLGDGSCFPAETTAAPIVIDGQVIGAVEVVRDITERRRLESDLAATEARYRTIVDQSPVMIWRTGADGRFDYFNRRWLDFRGRSAEQEMGDAWTEGVHTDDLPRVRETFRAALDDPKPFLMEYRLQRRDGEYRWITDHGLPYHGAAGEFLGFLGSCLDISDRVELEQALKDRNAVAEEASLHKTQLLSALSHDARTPLNSVVLSAQLLEMHIPERSSNAEIEECLRTIRHSVKNVLDLLQDLLDLSKIDAGATPAEPTRFELGMVLAECLGGIEAPARQKGLDCRLDPDGLDGLTLETDRAKLKQILGNFLSNALRYTQRGRITLRGRIDGDDMRISVSDTGPGIDPADQPRIFDEFATLANPLRPQGEGTGLGLAICRRLAGLLKGRIDLESAPGVGSTFTLVLPGSSVANGPAWEPNGTAEATAPASNGGGVIVVAEDDPASRRILSRVLHRLGYAVREAANGRDALDLVESERPMAVLMDVNMPVMDGIDATIALRADSRFRDLPIFALTGDVSTINRRRIGDAGVDGYLEKPLTLDALRHALDGLARRQK